MIILVLIVPSCKQQKVSKTDQLVDFNRLGRRPSEPWLEY